ncbi:hypothetical protein [Streptomyces sulphureus]|uniref:hypothetical protein n=1 Tax=Streptomyces sulphureus TaxID=47758 RepID=UPI00037AB5B7|nr:hypothetical protein [Streptomyces sulphureus]
MARDREAATVRTLLERHGTTYAEEADITLRDTPSPLYRLLVLSTLLSAPITSGVAIAAAAAISHAGMTGPRRMCDATWQQRVDALVEGHYRRYDESTATTLGNAARLLLDDYHGDLRRLRHRADGDTSEARALLTDFPGIGPVGADIFLREVQGVWPEFSPYLDRKTLDGAARLDLPRSPSHLADLAGGDSTTTAHLAAALVRSALSKEVAEDVRTAA